MKVVGYVRVSTRKQTEGESLQAQEEEIREWAAANGHSVVGVYGDEGKAGALEAVDRPGLLETRTAWRSETSAAWLAPCTYRRQS